MTSSQGSKRPKLRVDTLYIAVEDGVWFRTDRGSFKVKGPSAYQVMERLAPLLDGRFSVDEICEGLPAEQATAVRKMVSALFERGCLKDVSEDPGSESLPGSVDERFEPQIRFLDHYANSAVKRFERFRRARILCLGHDQDLSAVVAAMFELGAAHVEARPVGVATAARERLVRAAAYYAEDPAMVFADPRIGDREDISGSDGSDYSTTFDYVVGFLVSPREATVLQRASAQGSTVFLPAVCVGGQLSVGPLSASGKRICWECAWRRLHQDVRGVTASERRSPVAVSMAAYMLAYDLFKHATGAVRPAFLDRVGVIDTMTLSSELHEVLEHPLCTSCRPSRTLPKENDRRGPRGITAAPDDADTADHELITDRLFGLVASIEEGDLEQVPVARSTVRVADPNSVGGRIAPRAITVAGLHRREVRHHAILAALEDYSRRLVDGASRPAPVLDGELEAATRPPQAAFGVDFLSGQTVPTPADVVYPGAPQPKEHGSSPIAPSAVGDGAGVGFTEAVLRGTISAALSRCWPYGTVSHPLEGTPGSTIEDDEARRYLQVLRRLGLEVEIRSGMSRLGLPIAEVWAGGKRMGDGAHLGPMLAVRMALCAAVARSVGGPGHVVGVIPRSRVAPPGGTLAKLRNLLQGAEVAAVALDIAHDPSVSSAGFNVARMIFRYGDAPHGR